MKYLLIIVFELILTVNLFTQNDKLYISHFMDQSIDGQYFFDAMSNPEPGIYTWGPKVLDSIAICGKVLRKQLENKNAHPHHRLYCVNKLLLNYTIGMNLEAYFLNPDMVKKYADTLMISHDKYVPTVDDSLSHYSLYSEFEKAPFFSDLMKGIALGMKGDYESMDYWIGSARERIKDFKLLKSYKPNFKSAVDGASVMYLASRGECTESYRRTKEDYQALKSDVLRGMASEISPDEKETLEHQYENDLETGLYSVLTSCGCIVDSLKRVDDMEGAELFLEENKQLFLDYNKMIENRTEADASYALDYNVHYIANSYFIETGNYEVALQNLDKYKDKLPPESFSLFVVEMDRIRVNAMINPREALREIEEVLGKLKDDNLVRIGYSTPQTQLYAIKGDILYKDYVSNKDLTKLAAAIKSYEKAIEENDVLMYGQSNMEGMQVIEGTVEPLYNKLSNSYLSYYKEKKDFEYLKKSIAINDESKDFLITQKNNGIYDEMLSKSKYRKLIEKDKYIQGKLYLFQSHRNSKKIGGMKGINTLDSLLYYKNESKEFMSYIKEHEKDYFIDKYTKKNLDIDGVMRSLGEETLIINYACNMNATYAYIIGSKGIEVVELPRKGKWINGIVALNKSLREGGMKKYKKYAPSIYEDLFAPILTKIPEGIKRLVIVPDDEINDLVFGALPVRNKDGNGNSYLIEKYAISYQYSIKHWSDTKVIRQSESNLDFLGFVMDSDINENMTSSRMGCSGSPLNIARTTTNDISKLFKNVKIETNAKDETAIEKMKNADIIHFAVHGCIGKLNNPLNYYLQLSSVDKNDLELDIAEIYNSELQAKLVVLSACESGLGQLKRGTGLNSIARAFHYAGCPNTIATTAVVDEKSTSEILLDFYQFLLLGNPLDVALQKAKITYLEKNGKEMEPYIWTNIILIGNSNPINSN